MALPLRSPAHLRFIRSLPCVVCLRTRAIEAAHVGRRGLGQKCSDLDTLPLCSAHHREQHRIGLRQFQKTYELDIPALLEMLQEKPRLFVKRHFTPGDLSRPSVRFYFASYRDECFKLLPAALGVGESIALALDRCREYLIESYFHAERERRQVPGRFR